MNEHRSCNDALQDWHDRERMTPTVYTTMIGDQICGPAVMVRLIGTRSRGYRIETHYQAGEQDWPDIERHPDFDSAHDMYRREISRQRARLADRS